MKEDPGWGESSEKLPKELFKKAILSLLLDLDGNLYAGPSEESKSSFQSLRQWLLMQNKKFINEIKKMLQENPHIKDVVVSIASNRQSYYIDLYNRNYHYINSHDERAASVVEIFDLIIEILRDELKEFNVTIELNDYLLADTLAPKEDSDLFKKFLAAGTSFSGIKKKLDFSTQQVKAEDKSDKKAESDKNAELKLAQSMLYKEHMDWQHGTQLGGQPIEPRAPFCDSKLLILHALMNQLKEKYGPDIQLKHVFFDDRRDILDPLFMYYFNNPKAIPKDDTLEMFWHICRILGENRREEGCGKLAIEQNSLIMGKGKFDKSYQETLCSMHDAAMDGVNYRLDRNEAYKLHVAELRSFGLLSIFERLLGFESSLLQQLEEEYFSNLEADFEGLKVAAARDEGSLIESLKEQSFFGTEDDADKKFVLPYKAEYSTGRRCSISSSWTLAEKGGDFTSEIFDFSDLIAMSQGGQKKVAALGAATSKPEKKVKSSSIEQAGLFSLTARNIEDGDNKASASSSETTSSSEEDHPVGSKLQ